MRTQVGPFVMIPWWVLERCQDASALRLYAFLGKYADREGLAWPSVAELAKVMGVSKRSIERMAGVLRRVGVLRTEARRNGHGSVVGLDFILIQVERQSPVSAQTAKSGGLLNEPSDRTPDEPQTAKSGGLSDAIDEPSQTAKSGGLSESLTAKSGGDSPPNMAVISKGGTRSIELEPKNLSAVPTLTSDTDEPAAGDDPATLGPQQLLDRFADRWTARFHGKPTLRPGKDHKLLKDLIACHGSARVLEILDWFFRAPRHPFLREAGYTVGVFYGCFDQLQVSYRPDPRDETAPHLGAARTAAERHLAQLRADERQNRERNRTAAWLAIRALPEAEAAALRAHALRECDGDSHYRRVLPPAAVERFVEQAMVNVVLIACERQLLPIDEAIAATLPALTKGAHAA